MGEVPDDLVMAYIDGELDGEEHAAERARVERALASDAALRLLAERFRATRLPVQAALDPVLREPVPQALIDFVRTAPMGKAAGAAADGEPMPRAPANTNVAEVDFAARRAAPSVGAGSAPMPRLSPLRMAAGVALLVLTGMAGWQIGARQSATAVVVAEPRNDRWTTLAAALQARLESSPSGQDVPVALRGDDAARLRITATFVDHDKRYCRQYAVTTAPATLDGIACRIGDGEWLVEYQARRPIGTNAVAGMRTAMARSRASIDQMVDDMSIGSSLDAHEEALLLKTRWAEKLPER